MRRNERERQEEGLLRCGLHVVGNPLLAAGGVQVGAVAGVQPGGDEHIAIPHGVHVGFGVGVAFLLGVVAVAGQVVVVAEEVVEPAAGGPGGCRGGRAAALHAAAYAPLADEGGGIAGLAQHARECVGVLQRGVEAVVADDFGVALVGAAEDGGARRCAHGGCGVVAAHLHALLGHPGQARGADGGRAHCAIGAGGGHIDIEVAPAHVIHQHEDDVGLVSGTHHLARGQQKG